MTEQHKKQEPRPVGTGTAGGKHVKGAPFPHLEPAKEGRNSDRVPRVPEGPQRGPAGPTRRTTRPEERPPADDHQCP